MSKHKMLQILTTKKTMGLDKERWRIFGNWLKSEREKANLSQDGLADLVGVDRQTIYRLENAISGTKRETVLVIANALKVGEAIALNKAGFATQNSSPDSHEILEGVTIQFDQSVKLSGKDKDEILNAIRLVAAGVKAKQESEGKE